MSRLFWRALQACHPHRPVPTYRFLISEFATLNGQIPQPTAAFAQILASYDFTAFEKFIIFATIV